MKYPVCLPLFCILLATGGQAFGNTDGAVRSGGNDLSARHADAWSIAGGDGSFRAAPGAVAPRVYFAQAAGSRSYGTTGIGARSAGALRQVVTSEWTGDEIANNRRLFLERYQYELQTSMIELQRRIHFHELEIAQNRHSEVLDDDKIAKCDEFLKKVQALIRANQFPAELDGEKISKKELQELRAAYESLRTQTQEHRQQFEDLIRAAESQLILHRAEMRKKTDDLKTAGTFIRRLDSKEKTPDIGAVHKALQAGKSLTEAVNEVFSGPFTDEKTDQ